MVRLIQSLQWSPMFIHVNYTLRVLLSKFVQERRSSAAGPAWVHLVYARCVFQFEELQIRSNWASQKTAWLEHRLVQSTMLALPNSTTNLPQMKLFSVSFSAYLFQRISSMNLSDETYSPAKKLSILQLSSTFAIRKQSRSEFHICKFTNSPSSTLGTEQFEAHQTNLIHLVWHSDGSGYFHWLLTLMVLGVVRCGETETSL